jgi:L-amino acid N-acyltransferase YncA
MNVVIRDCGESDIPASLAIYNELIATTSVAWTERPMTSQVGWGMGVGRLLMNGLVARARTSGIHVMVGAVDAANVDSIRFHERMGFAEVARMPEVGIKRGRRLDLVLMQRILG